VRFEANEIKMWLERYYILTIQFMH
jgi:hypothetical protein